MGDKALYAAIEEQLPVFFQSWWLDIVCEQAWDVVMENGASGVTVVWTYSYVRKAGMLLLRNPPLTPYLGPLRITRQSCTGEELSSLYKALPRSAFRQWSCMPGISYEEWFTAQGLSCKKKRTYLLDLQLSEDTLWNAIHPKRKNAIRKAQQDLLVDASFPELKTFIEWQSASFTAKGKPYPYSESILRQLMQTGAQKGCSRAYTARNAAGEIQAAIWLVQDKTTIYYLLSATPAQTHRGAVSLLLWEAILKAKEQGLSIFDFEGSMDDDIAHFFKRFGGNETCYEAFQKTDSLIWKLKQRIAG